VGDMHATALIAIRQAVTRFTKDDHLLSDENPERIMEYTIAERCDCPPPHSSYPLFYHRGYIAAIA